MKHKKDAVTMVLITVAVLFFLATTIMYDQLRNTKADLGKLIWCWEEYNAVDRSIEQCIDDNQDTIEGCVQFHWRDKTYLINEMGCP